ncbi:hypothetical protein J9978_02630 [Chromobacterium violaceum]|uniref:GumC family protein n=1 Tax=Chromobacterium violaceum TaxID=536 RepID=UPI001B33EF5A|nr:Wzz/FepE/Etk N-terminal domain-containing protein [Chromobacterium violaceum]MBP4048394.1 hypothetical protein [Chromobacterium violaceum]
MHIVKSQPGANEISLMDVFRQIFHCRYWVLGCILIFGGAALVFALQAQPIFTATSTILPPHRQSSNISALLNQAGGAAGIVGSANGIGLKSPGDLYVGMLKSRSVSDQLIKRFNLEKRYRAETRDEARISLQAVSYFLHGKDGLISVSVDDEDPKFAAILANAYIEELIKLNHALAVTDAAKNRLFIERQLKQAKQDLAAAEIALQQTQKRTGLVLPDRQLPAIVSSVTQLRANIAAKEVQLEAMRSYVTKESPLYIRTYQELAGLRRQLEKLAEEQRSDLQVSTSKIAESGLEYLRRLRDVKYQESICELLAKQYELAKIDEAKDSSLIQVLDVAIPPQMKSKPKRSMIIGLGLITGIFIGVGGALAKSWLDRYRTYKGRWL